MLNSNLEKDYGLLAETIIIPNLPPDPKSMQP